MCPVKMPKKVQPPAPPERTQTADMLKMNERARPGTSPDSRVSRRSLRTDIRSTGGGSGVNVARMG